MTDPTPNAPMPTPLSPAAQAVLDAVVSHPSFATRKRIAAALYAAADQVVPEESEPSEQPFADSNDPWPTWHANKKTRREILAIATELKGHD